MDPRPLDETGQRFEMAGVQESGAGVPPWLKVVAGCGCVLVLVAGGVVGALGAGVRWLFGSGEQVPAAWIAGADSAGVFHTDSLGSDPGFAAFALRLIEEVDRLQREAAGSAGAVPWLEDLERERGAADLEGSGEWLPTDVALVLERVPTPAGPAGTAADLEVACAVNLPRLARLVRTLVRGATEEVEPHGDHAVRRGQDGGPYFGFDGGTLIVAAGPSALGRCLDRLDARRAEDAPDASEALGGARLAGLAARADVLGLLRDRAAVDAVVAFLGRAGWVEPGEFDWLPADLVDVALGLDLSTDDELAGEVVVTCADADSAERTLAALREQVAAWTARADRGELELTVAAARRGERVEATLRARGLGGVVTDLARRATAR